MYQSTGTLIIETITMERMMTPPWSIPTDWGLPSMFEARDMRMAPYELVDRGNSFELQLEIPGIERKTSMSRRPSTL
jgi:hypothetical protein